MQRTSRMWQYAMLGCRRISRAAVGGVSLVGGESKIRPFVVEVDRLGEVGTVGVIEPMQVRDLDFRAELRRFIIDSRMVSFDRMAQADAIWRVYYHLNDEDLATTKITAYMKDPATSPTVRAEENSVEVKSSTLLKGTGEQWEAVWTETVWSRETAKIDEYQMRGLFYVYHRPPSSNTTVSELEENPRQIYIRDFSWSRIME